MDRKFTLFQTVIRCFKFYRYQICSLLVQFDVESPLSVVDFATYIAFLLIIRLVASLILYLSIILQSVYNMPTFLAALTQHDTCSRRH
jgi:hypothetical protein